MRALNNRSKALSWCHRSGLSEGRVRVVPKRGDGLSGSEKSGLIGEMGSFTGFSLHKWATFLSTRTSARPCSKAAMQPFSRSFRSEGSPAEIEGRSFATV